MRWVGSSPLETCTDVGVDLRLLYGDLHSEPR